MNEVDTNKVLNPENVTDENVSNETPKMSLTGNIEDYKLVIDLTRDMKQKLSDAREEIHDSLRKEGFKVPEILEDMVLLSKDDIENNVDKIRAYLVDHAEDNRAVEENILSMHDADIFEKIKEINKCFVFIHTIEKEYHDIVNESKEILEEYFNYINSTRVEDSLRKRLEVMKSIEEIDDKMNLKNKRQIKILENSLNLSFLEESYSNVDRVVETYFKDNLSSYVIKKYKAKIRRYGYSEDIFIHFFDIEETFLEEKYHPFNNLFLFIYMSFVGHTDPYRDDDGLYVRAITGAIANLIYHRFDSTDREKEFVSYIESVLDKFIDAGYTDRFIMDNTSYKNNEKHLMAEKVMQEEKIQFVKDKLDYYKIDYNDDMSLEELMKLFDDKYDELEKKALAENTDEEVDKTISDVEDVFKIDEINEAIDNIKGHNEPSDEESDDTEELEEEGDDSDEAVDENEEISIDSIVEKINNFLHDSEKTVDGLVYGFHQHIVPDNPLLLGTEQPTHWTISLNDTKIDLSLNDNDIDYEVSDEIEVIISNESTGLSEYLRFTCDGTIEFLSKEFGLSNEV